MHARRVCVCVCVCIGGWMPVSMYVYVYIHMYVCSYGCTYKMVYFNTTCTVLEVPSAPLTPGSADSRASSLGRNGTLQATYPTSPQRSSPQIIATSQQMLNQPTMVTTTFTHMDEPGDYSMCFCVAAEVNLKVVYVKKHL